MHPTSTPALALAGLVGLLAGTHVAIWGMYKDALHEGFWRSRFVRSLVVGAACGVVLQATLRLALPDASALVVLFGLAYACERGAVELWKTFLRVEDQSKYFIPMGFSVRGVPVANRWVRLAVGAGYVLAVTGAFLLIARLDRSGTAPLNAARTALAALGAGTLVAIGGAWKDAPLEGFDPIKFLRSPSVTVLAALLLGRLAHDYVLAVGASMGFERAIVETWKKFTDPLSPPGKFAGKPVLYPHMRTARRAFVPVFVAIWLVVLGSVAAALAGGGAGTPLPSADALVRS
jgi:hypothetical protein